MTVSRSLWKAFPGKAGETSISSSKNKEDRHVETKKGDDSLTSSSHLFHFCSSLLVLLLLYFMLLLYVFCCCVSKGPLSHSFWCVLCHCDGRCLAVIHPFEWQQNRYKSSWGILHGGDPGVTAGGTHALPQAVLCSLFSRLCLRGPGVVRCLKPSIIPSNMKLLLHFNVHEE